MISKVLGVLAVATVASSPAAAATTTYDDYTMFLAGLGSFVIDDYSNPGYAFVQSDAQMSAVLGETDYTATGFSNINIVNGGTYCAGCNGSFRLSFGTTSFTSGAGVYGVGFDIAFNFAPAYSALVTFGDSSTALYSLTSGSSSVFGITSDLQIASIHFGPGGGVSTDGAFAIANLAIGAARVAAVPEPSTWALLILGFGLVGAAKRGRVRVSASIA